MANDYEAKARELPCRLGNRKLPAPKILCQTLARQNHYPASVMIISHFFIFPLNNKIQCRLDDDSVVNGITQSVFCDKRKKDVKIGGESRAELGVV